MRAHTNKIFGKSRLGDWRYIVERSRVPKFLKNIFIKRKFFFHRDEWKRKIFTMGPEREQPLHHRWADSSVIFFIFRKIELSYIYIKINIFYLRIGTWVYTWLVYERASIYIIRKSRLGDWRYIVERSRVQKFLKINFFKRKFYFTVDEWKRKFSRWVPSESNPCTIAERTRVLFLFYN